jgi:hypothetical protein
MFFDLPVLAVLGTRQLSLRSQVVASVVKCTALLELAKSTTAWSFPRLKYKAYTSAQPIKLHRQLLQRSLLGNNLADDSFTVKKTLVQDLEAST